MPAARRLPGDPAPGDSSFGPLGGLPDQVHLDARRRSHARDLDGERRLRAARGERPASRRGPIGAALARLIAIVRRDR